MPCDATGVWMFLDLYVSLLYTFIYLFQILLPQSTYIFSLKCDCMQSILYKVKLE